MGIVKLKTMGDSIQPINLDARVVKTVRNLKMSSIIKNDTDSSDDSTSTNPQNINSIEKSEDDKESKKVKSRESFPEDQSVSKKDLQIRSKMNSIIKSSSNQKRESSIRQQKILIDSVKNEKLRTAQIKNSNKIESKKNLSKLNKGQGAFNAN